MGPTAWATATAYPKNCQILSGGTVYISSSEHTSAADTEPGVGANWNTVWNVYNVPGGNVVDVLDNFATEYPQWAAQGFEIAGFVWWQGHKDGGEQGSGTAGLAATTYEANLVNLIDSLRDYYEARYPAEHRAQRALRGGDLRLRRRRHLESGQQRGHDLECPDGGRGSVPVSRLCGQRGLGRHPRLLARRVGIARECRFPLQPERRTYLLTGDATGRAMIGLLGNTTEPDYDSWASQYPSADLSDPNADLTGNGWTNNEARLFGLDPTSGASVNPYATPFDASAGTFSYTRRDTSLTGATYEVWTTTDLITWTRDNAAVQNAGTPDSNGVETVSVTLSASAVDGKLFAQVRVVE